MIDYASDFDSIPVTQTKSAPSDYASDFDAIKPAASASNPAVNPLDGMTNWQKAMAGAGKAVVDMGRGAKQLIDIPAVYLESHMPGISDWSQQALGMPSAAQSSQATNADVASSRKTDVPLMADPYGIGGNIAGNVASTMIPLSAIGKAGQGTMLARGATSLVNPSTYTSAAASGALQGLLQPTIDGESKGLNTAIGAGAGLAGNAVVNTIGRVAQPIKNVLSSSQQKAIQVLQNAGIPLDASQLSGSAFLNKIRSSLSDNPFTSSAQSELAARQQAGYNNAVLNTFGSSGPSATSDVMGNAADRINGVFKDVLSRNNIQLDHPTLANMMSIQNDANLYGAKPVSNMVDRLVNHIGDDGTIPGQEAYNLRKQIGVMQGSADPDVKRLAGQLNSTFMNGMNSSLPDADAAALTQARTQFRNMKLAENAVSKDGAGNISPSRLANVMSQKSNRSASIYGRGDQDIVDLAHSGNMLLPDKNPNSGTASRMMMQMLAPSLLGSAAGGAAGYEADGGSGAGIGSTAGLLLGGLAAPKASQYLINNPATSNLLTKGMTGAMTPIKDILQSPQNSQLIGGALRRLPASAAQTEPFHVYVSGVNNQ